MLQASVYGPFQTLSTASVTGAPTCAVAGDFDGDGNADLALTSASSIMVLLNSGG